MTLACSLPREAEAEGVSDLHEASATPVQTQLQRSLTDSTNQRPVSPVNVDYYYYFGNYFYMVILSRLNLSNVGLHLSAVMAVR